MPVFDYGCACGNRADDIFVHKQTDTVNCKVCNKQMRRLFPNRIAVSVFPADGIFIRDASPKGKRFFSKQEMRDYQKAHKVELGALL